MSLKNLVLVFHNLVLFRLLVLGQNRFKHGLLQVGFEKAIFTVDTSCYPVLCPWACHALVGGYSSSQILSVTPADRGTRAKPSREQ
jgi:hypothetical protein